MVRNILLEKFAYNIQKDTFTVAHISWDLSWNHGLLFGYRTFPIFARDVKKCVFIINNL